MSTTSTAPRPDLTIRSLEELRQQEGEILLRIQAYPDNLGGNLFVANPFLLLADVGVTLTDEAKQELIVQFPSLATLSEIPYQALQNSAARQGIRIRLSGIFPQQGTRP